MSAPALTQADAQDDAGWFRGSQRRYRLRRTADGCWLIRRRGAVLLRCWIPTLPIALPDSDEALRPHWFLAAFPTLPAKQRATLVEKARQAKRG